MHERQRNAFVKCQKFLLNNLDPDVKLLRHCEQERVLSDEQIQQIESETTKFSKVARLLESLKRANHENFQVFLEILEQNNQAHVAQRIKGEFDEQCKGQPKLPNVKESIKTLVFSETIFKKTLSDETRTNLMEKTVTKDDYDTVVQQRNQFLAKCDEWDALCVEKSNEVTQVKNMADVYKTELQKYKALSTKLCSDKEHLCSEVRSTMAEKRHLEDELAALAQRTAEMQRLVEEQEATLTTLTKQKSDLLAKLKEKDNQLQSMPSGRHNLTSTQSLSQLPIFVEEEQDCSPRSDDGEGFIKQGQLSATLTVNDRFQHTTTPTDRSLEELSGIWQKLQKVAKETQNLQVQIQEDEDIFQNIHSVIDALLANVRSTFGTLPCPPIKVTDTNEEQNSIEDNNYNEWVLGGETDENALQTLWAKSTEKFPDETEEIEQLRAQVKKYKDKLAKSRKDVEWLKETVFKLRVPSASSSSNSSYYELQRGVDAAKRKSITQKLPQYLSPSGRPKTSLQGMVQSKSLPGALPYLAENQKASGQTSVRMSSSQPRSVKFQVLDVPKEIGPERVGVLRPTTSNKKTKSILTRSKTECYLNAKSLPQTDRDQRSHFMHYSNNRWNCCGQTDPDNLVCPSNY